MVALFLESSFYCPAIDVPPVQGDMICLPLLLLIFAKLSRQSCYPEITWCQNVGISLEHSSQISTIPYNGLTEAQCLKLYNEHSHREWTVVYCLEIQFCGLDLDPYQTKSLKVAQNLTCKVFASDQDQCKQIEEDLRDSGWLNRYPGSFSLYLIQVFRVQIWFILIGGDACRRFRVSSGAPSGDEFVVNPKWTRKFPDPPKILVLKL